MNDFYDKNEPRMRLMMGDLTQLEVDAIVNAAKESLTGGGGVDGAIHRAGGITIYEECMEIPVVVGYVRCPTGEARLTNAGKMPAKRIIHTVGPIWKGGKNNEPALLANAYKNSLLLAKENGLFTVAFPNVSTGIYDFPKELAAEIALKEVRHFLAENPTFKEVVFCCFDTENYHIYENLMK